MTSGQTSEYCLRLPLYSVRTVATANEVRANCMLELSVCLAALYCSVVSTCAATNLAASSYLLDWLTCIATIKTRDGATRTVAITNDRS